MGLLSLLWMTSIVLVLILTDVDMLKEHALKIHRIHYLDGQPFLDYRAYSPLKFSFPSTPYIRNSLLGPEKIS